MDAPLSIASYNVHGCIGTDGRCDVERVAAVIRELDCDVVGLQEVFGRHGEHGEPQQLEKLAAATGMEAVAGATLKRGTGDYGNALLTRHRVLAVQRHDLSVPRCEPRGALEVDLETRGPAIRLVVTHLGLFPSERGRQVQQILEVLRATPADMTIVLLGDMNEWLPTSTRLKWLHELLEQAPAAPSWPVWWPLLSLDRIWTRPRRALTHFEVHRSRLSRRASDHYPVKARVVPGA